MKVKSRNMLRVPGWFNQAKKAVRSRITHKIYQSFAPVLISIKMSNTRIIDSKIELLINQFAIWLMREQIVTEPIWRPSHPSRVRGLKSMWYSKEINKETSHPSRVRGLKCWRQITEMRGVRVAPFTGAWIEMEEVIRRCIENEVAPFTGAWIEILTPRKPHSKLGWSHPSRVRGLKFSLDTTKRLLYYSRTLHGCVDWNLECGCYRL